MNNDHHKYARHSVRLKDFNYSNAGGYFVTVCTKLKEHCFGKIVSSAMVLSPAGKLAHDCWLTIPHHFTITELDEFVIMPNHIHGILFIVEKDKPDCGRDRVVSVGTDYNLSCGASPQQSGVSNTVRAVGTDYNLSSGTPFPRSGVSCAVGSVRTDYNLSLRQQHLQQNNPQKHEFQHVIPKSLSYIIATFKAAVSRQSSGLAIPFAWQPRFYDHVIRSNDELDRIRRYITDNPLQWEFDRENRSSENYSMTHDRYFRGIYDG